MLTKEQIIELLRENPDYSLPEDATEEEQEWYQEALSELGLSGDDMDENWDDDEDEDWDLDDEDLDSDEDDEDWDADEL
ncbi:hypothetical protein KBG31_00150 [Patescibacteria group bacterium]|nr:hypothetical protein [Patescibacteria group bacterium]HOM78251.1 hypothetical protein [bacterium]